MLEYFEYVTTDVSRSIVCVYYIDRKNVACLKFNDILLIAALTWILRSARDELELKF